jgi:hypothetical protein
LATCGKLLRYIIEQIVFTMKKLILSALVFSGFVFGHSFAKANDAEVKPGIEQPSPVEKKFHQLDAEYEFKLFNHEGKLLLEGTSDKVEITGLKPGAYFVSYNGKTERVIVPGVAGS